jgi:hypothetical protein
VKHWNLIEFASFARRREEGDFIYEIDIKTLLD